MCASVASRPPSSAQRGNSAPVSPVLPAVYGYWSPATSSPSSLARSNSASASDARPPDRRPHALHVRNLDADAGAPSHLDGLVDSDEQPHAVVALVAHMRRVQLAAPCRLVRHLDNLIQPRVVPRRVEQPRREPHRARVQALTRQRPHAVQLVAGRRARIQPQHARAQRGVAHLHRDIQRRLRRLQRVQVAAEVVVAQRFGVFVLTRASLEKFARRAQQRRAETGTAVARQLQRNALPHLALRRIVQQERHIAVRVQVDESGRNHQPRCVDAPGGLALKPADGRNLVADDANVRPVRGAPRPVDYPSVLDEQVIHGGPPGLCWGAGQACLACDR